MDIAQHFYEAEYQLTGADPKNALPHHDSCVELIQTWSDGGFFIVKNNVFPIKPGTVFLIDGTNTHYSNPTDQSKYNRSKVIVSGAFFQQICQLCALENTLGAQMETLGGCAIPFPPAGSSAQRIDQLFSQLAEIQRNLSAPYAQLHLISAFVQLLECVSGVCAQAETANDSQTIHRLAQYINTHLNNWDDVRMTDISEALHISQSRASHLFKELTGKTLTQYTNDLRIAEAKKLLLATQMRIKDISGLLKFQTPAIFCKYFKKFVGCTPLQYRQGGGISLKNP